MFQDGPKMAPRRLQDGPSWGPLGTSWRPLGASWGPLGSLLGASWRHLGASAGVVLTKTKNELFEASFKMRLGAVLEPSWGYLEAMLGASWAILGDFKRS